MPSEQDCAYECAFCDHELHKCRVKHYRQKEKPSSFKGLSAGQSNPVFQIFQFQLTNTNTWWC